MGQLGGTGSGLHLHMVAPASSTCERPTMRKSAATILALLAVSATLALTACEVSPSPSRPTAEASGSKTISFCTIAPGISKNNTALTIPVVGGFTTDITNKNAIVATTLSGAQVTFRTDAPYFCSTDLSDYQLEVAARNLTLPSGTGFTDALAAAQTALEGGDRARATEILDAVVNNDADYIDGKIVFSDDEGAETEITLNE